MAEAEDAANAPLIGSNISNDQSDSWEHEAHDERESTLSQEQALTSPSAFIWALTFAAGISGLLFGYEYISSA